jgi:four helix bundle protein
MIKEYKFQKLAVYQLALYYVDEVYSVIPDLPEHERYNLCTQFRRAGTSIPLNIAEGSTGQTNREQHRFLGIALRSYLETIACMDLIERRSYLDSDQLNQTRQIGHRLFIKLVSFRKKLINNHSQ